ncbi:MAG: amidohydrolase family protein [Thermoplasmata archaeon]|nr:MAG: amidohydrolase family protein [Thermoplasmata archaeon]
MHIGDAVVCEEVSGGIAELVGPPDGLKHRVLQSTSNADMLSSMRDVIHKMLHAGIEHFCDFREGGSPGVSMLRTALKDSPLRAKIFGRPQGLHYDEEEISELLRHVDGIGLSAVSDWDRDIEKISKHTLRERKGFAFHASEREREDIDTILDLRPDFLIHMNEATDDDLVRCSDAGVPIVVTPRAEMFFNRIPDIPRMVEKGICVALGTDNAMLNTPHSMLREMEFAYTVSKPRGDLKAMDILNMALSNGRKVLNAGDDICLTSGMEANFIVFALSSKSPAYTLVKQATTRDISLISMNGYIWQRS